MGEVPCNYKSRTSIHHPLFIPKWQIEVLPQHNLVIHNRYLSRVLEGLSCVEVADIKTIKHDKARKINEYSRCAQENSRTICDVLRYTPVLFPIIAD